MSEAQARRVAILGSVLWLALHVYWIFRIEINWDEFALLARAHESLSRGQLIGGGRPGLTTLILMPIVDGCKDSVAAAIAARLLWLPFVAAILVGLWLLLAGLFRSRATRWRDSLWGLSLFALTPAFLHYSVQVRTDQPAIAFGLLGGIALLASRTRVPLAAVAGLLFAIGFLSSQKLVYVAALVGVLAVTESLIEDRFRWKRDAGRIALVIAAGLVTLWAFRTGVSLFIRPAPPTNVGGQLNWFAFYREHIGYGYYLLMLPGLLVPVGLAFLAVSVAPIAVLRRGAAASAGGMVLAIAAVGTAVAGFHAGALPYFWMTLGLFPALAAAAGMPLLRQAMGEPARRAVLLGGAGVLVGTAVIAGIRESRQSLELQRETMALVETNFPADREGFSTKQALFCRSEGTVFPVYFGPTLHEWTEARIDSFIEEFQSRPIAFMIASRDMEAFPPPIRAFWDRHYLPYRGTLMVPGIELSSGGKETIQFDVIVPGPYRLHAEDPGAAVQLDGEPLRANEARRLEAGAHEVTSISGGTEVRLTLDIHSPPGPVTDRFWTGH